MLDALRTQLVSVMQNDAALTALLHSPQAIYSHLPPKGMGLPCLCVRLADRPAEAPARGGRTVAEVAIEVWSASGAAADAVVAALDDLLFDGHRDGALDTDAFRVGACRRVASEEAGDVKMRTADGSPILRRVTRWRMVLLKRGA